MQLQNTSHKQIQPQQFNCIHNTIVNSLTITMYFQNYNTDNKQPLTSIHIS
jgi:hypothetical protein